MQKLIEAINQYNRVSPETEQAIISSFERTDVSTNEYLIKESQYCRKLWFLESGALRSYYYRDGKDITSWFYTDEQFFSSWFGFYSQYPSTENIHAVSESIIYSISYDKFQELNDDYTDFTKFSRFLAEYQLAAIDIFSKGIMFMSAKEKYDMFLEHFPEAFGRFNLGHIATFLGISQETLSRIRRQK